MRAVSASRAKALYVGTEVSGKWWKRHRAPGFSAKGNGTYRFEDDELVFDRYLTRELTRIPVAKVTGVTVGTWHAGTWQAGKPIVKVAWEDAGERRSSGFCFADRPSADAFVVELEGRRFDTG
jgi:hypothetical protein